MFKITPVIVAFLAFFTLSNSSLAQCTSCTYTNSASGNLVVLNGQVACYTTTTVAGAITIFGGGKMEVCGVGTKVTASGSLSLFPSAQLDIYDCAQIRHTGSFSDFSQVAVFAYCDDCGTSKYPIDSALYRVETTDDVFTGWVCNSTLPVELVSFKAQKINNSDAQLTWVTASEIENDYFEVQRSLDGFTWETISVVVGGGTTNELSTYQTIDYAVGAEIAYYRLKQVDYNGTFAYSDVKVLRFDQATTDVAIFQSEGEISFGVELGGQVMIDVYDAAGKLVFSEQYNNSTQNGFVLSTNVSGFATGAYIVTVSNGSAVQTKKFIISQ